MPFTRWKPRANEILARNWRCAAGELDIVAQVRPITPAASCRRSGWCWWKCAPATAIATVGTPVHPVLGRKETKLREVARHYVQAMNWAGPWRIDVVAVQMDGSGHLQAVEHIRHAVHDE